MIKTVAGYVLSLAIVLVLFMHFLGCATFTKDVKIGEDVAVSCAKDPKIIADFLPAVVGALATSNWQSLLDTLYAKYGDVIVCAAEVIRRDEAAAAATQPAMARAVMPPSQAWLLGGHFVIVYPPPQQLKAPLIGPGGTVTYVPAH